MDEIKVFRIINQSGPCFNCDQIATQIIGGDYDVCDNPDCMELAFEKKSRDLEYIHIHRGDFMAEARYAQRLNK